MNVQYNLNDAMENNIARKVLLAYLWAVIFYEETLSFYHSYNRINETITFLSLHRVENIYVGLHKNISAFVVHEVLYNDGNLSGSIHY